MHEIGMRWVQLRELQGCKWSGLPECVTEAGRVSWGNPREDRYWCVDGRRPNAAKHVAVAIELVGRRVCRRVDLETGHGLRRHARLDPGREVVQGRVED